MKIAVKKTIHILFIVFTFLAVKGQSSIYNDSPDAQYRLGIELLEKRQYGAAQEYFQYVYSHTDEQQYDMKANAYFYQGLCAAKLNNNNAAFLLKDFIRKYPIHSYVPRAYFEVSKFYFYKKQYKKALENFKEINERKIEQSDLAEYFFKKGYAYLVNGESDEAKSLLRSARKYEGDYQYKAIYYLAHIAYEEGQYIAALEDFISLKNLPEYSAIVPFYISQIYFIQKEYDTVVAMVPPLLEKSADKGELNRIIALSYYHLDKYSKALPYFEAYLATLPQSAFESDLSRNDLYAMGYTNYKTQNWGNAIEFLSQCVKEKDELSQNAYYVMGDCYLKLQKYPLATQSFLEASKSDFNPEIQEDALYNYAKLQYETASVPFNNAIKALENYIQHYPYSSRSAEATEYLAAIYASTKNYEEAVKSIEKLSEKSPAIMRSYQRCSHFRALELINNREYKKAEKMIEKSMTYALDPTINLSNLYWKAETQYRNEQYAKAYASFQIYHQTKGCQKDPNYIISYYSAGYSALKIEKYKEAQKSFETFLSYAHKIDNATYEADAKARLGDCYYMQKNLNTAIKYYGECEKMKLGNADYALYQEAKCYGYLQNDKKKIELLEKFTQYFPKSPYIDEVEFELASTYHAKHQYTIAINAYQNFIKKYPKSPYVRDAHNRLAQAYLNSQNTEMSIATFKKVIEQYPGSREAKDAMANLENIYTELGKTGDFFDYIKSKGNINISAERQDSVTYRAAESKYVKGNCEMAMQGFTDYLKQFPNGLFAANAYFYRAECAYGNKSYPDALNDYEYLLKNYRTENNETALRRAATITYNQNNYAQALTYFNDLLSYASNDNNRSYAYNGIMRCAYALGNYNEALEGAKGYIVSDKADPELTEDAELIAGKSAYELRDYNTAKKYLQKLAKRSSNDIAAEAAYYCALIEYTQGNYDECEKKIGEILEANYYSGYWLASTFILYGDFYVAKKNYFQARHTYQSIVDNYDGEDLRKVAQEKIDALDALENGKKNEQSKELKQTKETKGSKEPQNLRPIDEE